MNTFTKMKKHSKSGALNKTQILENELAKKDEEILNLKQQLKQKVKELEEKTEQNNKNLKLIIEKDNKIAQLEKLLSESKVLNNKELNVNNSLNLCNDGLNKLKVYNLQVQLRDNEKNNQSYLAKYENIKKELKTVQIENKELKNKLKPNNNANNSINLSKGNCNSLRESHKSINLKNYEDKIKNLELRLSLAEKERDSDIIEKYKKEKEETQNRCDKEMELMSSAIYNLGFNYWSMKYTYEEKLKNNKNWLDLERAKQYNGDY